MSPTMPPATPLLNLVLYQPEIPPNTGNIIRLGANTGCQLHLVRPLAFQLDDKRLRRAGLDYGEWRDMRVHENWPAFLEDCRPQRLFGISTRGRCHYHEAAFRAGDYLVFGPETRGLPVDLLEQLPDKRVLRIPMRDGSRSMNLSNAVAVVVYEAWRQLQFSGAKPI